MKSSILALAVALIATSTASPLEKKDTAAALQRCVNTPDANACADVVTTISAWDDSVNGVNLFLNTFQQFTGQDLIDQANTALDFANREPGFLTTLSNTANLGAQGVAAVNFLMGAFPKIPTDLQNVVAGTLSAGSAAVDINNIRLDINFNIAPIKY
jgi:hypothetical protein